MCWMQCSKLYEQVRVLQNNYLLMNGSSSNPSDYEFLLRTLAEGNHVARAESLKRLNTLVLSDKKQFASYAKRIVIGIQDLMMQQKEDINLLACTLALEIINLNPRDIEFYIKTKLLKPTVLNLGDPKPQIRKTSHYCLLGYVRTFKNFDDLIEAYITYGIMSKEWQLKQKSINSFQSILVMEMRYVDWSSSLFKRIFELLLTKLKDQNGFVQKASEQCLLSLAKVSELRNFSKKLNPMTFNMLRGFCQQQYELGNLNEIKLDLGQKQVESERYNEPQSPLAKQRNGQSSTYDKVDLPKAQQKISPSKVNEPQQTFRKKKNERNSLKKAESSMNVSHHKQLVYSLNLREVRNPERQDNLKRQTSLLLPPIGNANNGPAGRYEKIQQIVGKKLMEDLKNDRDWKARLQAVQELQTKYQISRDEFDQEMLTRYFIPTLIKLLGDSNFKVALVSLKILEDILHNPLVNIQQLVPQLVDKLADNKVALRQNISKLIKRQYTSSKQPIWLDSLLLHIKKSANANIKEEVLNILYKVYDQGSIPYNFEKILEVICPLMEDLKTKIKIKTLDLMAIITIKSQKIDRAKNILATKMNQIYYEMYLEKIGKELKSNKEINQSPEKENHSERDKPMRTSMNHISRKINKIGNTTSTSLQRYTNPNKTDQNATVKTAFFQPHIDQKRDTIVSRESGQNYELKTKELAKAEVISVTDDETSSLNKKTSGTARYLRRRGQKSIESRLSTTNYSNDDGLPPFHDPNKELKLTLLELKSDDWQIANEALTKMRRFIRHHSDLLIGPTVKAVVPDVMKLSESLRSTLSKSAVIVINELSNKLKRQLDSEFDLIFSKLIKKSLDTNSFISQQVKKALINVCSNCNQSKVMNSLNASHTSRAIPVKVAIVNILQGITFQPRFYERQLQRIVLILCDFMNQGSLQIRQKTKQLLNSIISSESGPSIMKFIPNQHKNKLKKVAEVSPTITKCDLHLQSSIQEDKKQTQLQTTGKEEIYQRKKKKVKITSFPEEFEQIDSYLENCESSDWKTRLQNMTNISQLCKTYTEEILQHRSSSKIMDVLSKQINDPNVKVATNALKIFLQLVPIIRVLIQGSLSVILNEIFICFSSMKPEIKSLAEQLFDEVASNVQKWLLTQHMCNGALYSIQKSKPTIISKLTQLVPQIHKTKPNIFQKNVYPMINKVTEENKPELMGPLKELLEAIYAQTGEDCMSFLKQKAKTLIFQ